MRYEALTGLSMGQLLALAGRVAAKIGDVARPGGRPPALDLAESVVLVVYLMRRNPVQDEAGAIFGASQPTVSRRWDLLRPVIGKVLAEFVPGFREIGAFGTILVDGTVCPTWDWTHVPDLYSTKVGYPGMNLQIAAGLNGDLLAVGPLPVHGARHDAHAYAASGLKDHLAGLPQVADLGYVGVEGIELVPYKRAANTELNDIQAEFNRELSKIRAAVEHAIAKFKSWRMLSEEGGRFRCPLTKYESMLTAVIGLYFFRIYT